MEHHPTQQAFVETVAGSQEDIRIIKVRGPLTLNNFFDFQEHARKQPPARLLIVDLGNVPYLDSAALGSLVGIHVSCDRNGTKCALVNIDDRLKAFFSAAKVDQFLVIRHSIADAEHLLDG